MKRICSIFGTVITLIALATASSASILFFYQPKTPKCFINK
ncbi:MAG: cyclic lactone autoinducer peptide [Clostridia bacterium]|nr:cyclic lactone autoinducer peptide [Clostridia bacterium]